MTKMLTLFKKWLNYYKKYREIQARDNIQTEAITYVYKLIKLSPESERPTYHYSNFKPTVYKDCIWQFGSLKIRLWRSIKADLIEVFLGEDVIASWVDQSFQYNGLLGLNDIIITPSFSVEILKYWTNDA